MKVKENQKTLYNLVKIQLKAEGLYRRLSLSLIFFWVIAYKLMYSVKPLYEEHKLYINIWDGFFRVLSYPFFIMYIYIPFMLIITSLLLVKNDYGRYIMIRTRKKLFWVLGNLISTFIINLVFTCMFFIGLFIISSMFFRYDYKWSETILNLSQNSKLYLYLYPNGFVFEMTPICAIIISFMEIFLVTSIITLFRNLLMNFTQNIKLANAITILYLVVNILLQIFPINTGLMKSINYVSLNTMALLWYHRFKNSSYSQVTIIQSLLISFMLVIVLIILNVIFSRKLVVDNG